MKQAKDQSNRLTGSGLYFVILTLAKKAGIGHVRPHGIRHTSVTTLLDHNGGNMREARAFSRHADPGTLQLNDDARKNSVAHSTQLIASLLR